jgi:hypothetical protein
MSLHASAAGLVTLLALVLLTSSPASSQAEMTVLGGNPSMAISAAVTGQEPTSITNTTCTLQWRRHNVLTKVTVATACPGQRFTLSVVATSVSSGTAAPTVNLVNNMLAADFIVGIPTSGTATKTCRLSYTASASFAQGNSTELGNDVHVVTYTLQAQ